MGRGRARGGGGGGGGGGPGEEEEEQLPLQGEEEEQQQLQGTVKVSQKDALKYAQAKHAGRAPRTKEAYRLNWNSIVRYLILFGLVDGSRCTICSTTSTDKKGKGIVKKTFNLPPGTHLDINMCCKFWEKMQEQHKLGLASGKASPVKVLNFGTAVMGRPLVSRTLP
jgi:hypothetical protein